MKIKDELLIFLYFVLRLVFLLLCSERIACVSRFSVWCAARKTEIGLRYRRCGGLGGFRRALEIVFSQFVLAIQAIQQCALYLIISARKPTGLQNSRMWRIEAGKQRVLRELSHTEWKISGNSPRQDFSDEIKTSYHAHIFPHSLCIIKKTFRLFLCLFFCVFVFV